MDLAFTSAADLAASIRGRAVSPVEVMRDTLDRIERGQPTLNAFITVAAETAMAAARAAEVAVMRGGELGPLHGVPVAVKDLIPTAGIRTTWGSLIFKDHVPDRDSVAVARLKQAGAIVVGKTTTPEFGQQCLTQAPLFGPHAMPGGRTAVPVVRAADRRWRSRPDWCRSRSRRTVEDRPAFPPRATASSGSSKASVWCLRNTRRTDSAISPT
jgi:Asp-tRNA(Asn)/Glu-tRNA(Gln) amidotransferase A subunit family amidase